MKCAKGLWIVGSHTTIITYNRPTLRSNGPISWSYLRTGPDKEQFRNVSLLSSVS